MNDAHLVNQSTFLIIEPQNEGTDGNEDACVSRANDYRECLQAWKDFTCEEATRIDEEIEQIEDWHVN